MTTTNFLGIPVEGDITYANRHNVPQKPLEELAPLIQAVLDDPTIVEFGWTQYTPYFNDGDPCEFGVHDLWVRTDQDGPRYPEGDDELYASYGHPTLGRRDYRWEGKPAKRVDLGYVGPDEARYDRCVALDNAITGGAFYDVLLDNFGDHAEITVSKTGITVDYYEHD